MATKYALVTLFVLILLPFSLSAPTGWFKILSKTARRAYKVIDKIPSISPADGSIKYRNITYPYINITDKYYIDVAIGTPEVSYAHALLDMSSDLIWTNCDSSKSTTSTVIPCPRECSSLLGNLECPKECSYNFTYDDQDSTQVALARDYFTLRNLTLEKPLDIVFGCGTQNNGFFSSLSGIIGLGRGNLSLVSQMGYGNFSYCLNSNYSDISPLFLVSQPNLYGNQVNSTPLILNPHYTSAYYVNLIGISVDSKRLRIPSSTFSLQPDGSGGVLLDSGFFLTYLQKDGYEQVKEAIVSFVGLSQASGSTIGLDLCFSISDPNQLPAMPTITLHFGGANMVLDPYYYMVYDDNSGLLCSTLLPTPYDGLSVLGYQLQEDKRMFFDLKNSILSFYEVDCRSSTMQLVSESGSDLSFQVGVGLYFQILAGFMFQVLVGFIF
ncbi:aspartic proteinase nepenthesin-2-like [Typha angustifolia]|uniref:aspartic proteinase nepenthesin-2-like n=1 Tax=Typha angustifolia TaxID=59011 RepID=UPI003C2D5295